MVRYFVTGATGFLGSFFCQFPVCDVDHHSGEFFGLPMAGNEMDGSP